MKNILFAVLIIFTSSAFAEGELAVFSIEQRIEGMKVEGKPQGYGDRFLRFEYMIDASDLEAATEAWYAHMELLLGGEQVDQLRAIARAAER